MGNIQVKHPQRDLCSEIKLHDEEEEEGSMFTCEICTELKPSKMMFKNDKENCCQHPFCTDCMIKYIQVKLEQHVPHITCPALNCNHTLDIHHCRALIPNQLFVLWCDELFNLTVSKFDDRVYCPNSKCLELIVNECGGQIRKAACPKCKILFCFRCAIHWHAGFRCEDMGDTDDSFRVLAKRKRWRRCPECRYWVERSAGCFAIRCRCGTTFCHVCGGTWCNCDSIIAKILTCRWW